MLPAKLPNAGHYSAVPLWPRPRVGAHAKLCQAPCQTTPGKGPGWLVVQRVFVGVVFFIIVFVVFIVFVIVVERLVLGRFWLIAIRLGANIAEANSTLGLFAADEASDDFRQGGILRR